MIKTASARTDLVVALDVASSAQAEAYMEKLAELPVIYKVGLELFLSAGPEWVHGLCAAGNRIFLDLKFHDIPNTVAQAVIQASNLGVEFVTVHLAGGKRMLDEIEIKCRGRLKTNVLGVSVLTSFQEEDWIANVSHMAKVSSVRSIEDSMLHFASLASNHEAVQGMVCSPKEIEMIRLKHPDLYLMVPGIRPEGAALNDQSRVATPKEAMQLGASAIVVGRPITLAADPRAVAEKILKDIS